MICVSSVSAYPSSISLSVGDWYYGAYAVVSPSYATCSNITWRSSNSSVASVNSSSGYIYARSSGTARIYATATDGSGASDYIWVTVTSSIKVTGVGLSRSSLTIEKGDTYSLSATVCPTNATNKSFTWSSTNTSVATVSSSGVVTAKAKGSATIRATATDGSGCSASCSVSVTEDVLVTSVTVNPSSKTMTVGDSAYFYETVCPTNATNKCVLWTSSNTSVATVNAISGLVIARGAGTARIYASAQDGSGKQGSCALTVNGPICVEDITLSRSTLTLYKGNSFILSATVCPVNATTKTVRWSSSDSNVATVDASTGLVTAKSVGTAYIYATATDGSGVRDCCTVKVPKTVVCPTEETPASNVKESTFADHVEVYSGAHILKNTLMTLFGGQSLALTAHYNSTNLACGSLGTGWYHNYEKHVEFNAHEAYVYSSPTIYSKYVSEDSCCTVFSCTSANKNGYVLTVDCSQQYPYIINCNHERKEYYNIDGYLAKIVDHQGFETLITYSDTLITVTDTVSGKKMYLEKDASCKICRVYDDAERQATLTYTGDLLSSICDANGNSLTFTYDGYERIKTGTDSNNVCYFENTYDEYGRVIAQKDAITGSIKSTFTYQGNKRITTDRNGNQSTRVYNSNGLLTQFIDENGNTKTYEYDARYNVIKETDAKGNSVIKSYNHFNKPTQITDKNGNKTSLYYDGVGNVVVIQYPKINGVIPEEVFTYNSRNQLVQHKDIRGTTTVYTYDTSAMPATKKVGSRNAIQYSYENGLLKSQTDAKGNTTRYGYNTAGQLISKTDADDKTTQYEYDAVGNLLKTIDASGKSVVTTYDCNHQKTSVTDANGNKTEYSYNGNMKNDVITLPDGHTVRYEFDGEDRPVKITDQAGNVTTVQYDKGGRVTSKRSADGATVQYEYDAVGNVVKEINPYGAAVTKEYDNIGNVLSVTDNEGNITRYQYNAMSKPIRVSNAVSGATVYEYSPAGDLLSETDTLGNKKVYTYDAYGNKLTATDARGNITTYTYDANNNLLTVKDALNHITTYTYNCLNQCISVKDAKNNTVNYAYDALGRRTTVTDARGNTFTTVYDGNGNVVKTTDAKGNTVSETVYNCLNLPATVTDSVGKTTTYTYTALGKVESVTDPMNHRSEYSYNSRGQNTSVRDASNNTSTATYDLLGNVTKLAGPLGGATSYTYDEMGRLTSESTVSGGTKSYEYNELNIKKLLTNARGQQRRLFYDAMGRITGYISAEDSVSYTYDANGNVLSVTDKNGTVSREYDELNRVTKYTDTYGKVIRYEYDAVGNLTRMVYPILSNAAELCYIPLAVRALLRRKGCKKRSKTAKSTGSRG